MADAHAFHAFLSAQVNEMMRIIMGMPLPESRKRAFLLNMMAICSFSDMAVSQLRRVQGDAPKLPDLKSLPESADRRYGEARQYLALHAVHVPEMPRRPATVILHQTHPRMKFRFTAFLIFIISFHANAQQDTFATRMLSAIAAEQCQQDSFYYTGMFPCHRYYGSPRGKMKHDNNVFFTGLIAMTLGSCRAASPEQTVPAAGRSGNWRSLPSRSSVTNPAVAPTTSGRPTPVWYSRIPVS